MNVPVALWVAGCEDQATEYSSSIVSQSKKMMMRRRRRRQLQQQQKDEDEAIITESQLGGTTVEYSEVESWKEESGSACDSATADISCGTFSSRVIVFLLDRGGNNNIPEEIIQNRIYVALDKFKYLVTGNPGVFFMEIDKNNIELVLIGDDGDGVEDGGSSPDGINDAPSNEKISSNTGAIVGSIAAGLAGLLLGMICIVWLRHSDDNVRHSRFDDASEDYYQPEIVDTNHHHHNQSFVSTTTTPEDYNHPKNRDIDTTDHDQFASMATSRRHLGFVRS